jgi:hypothetical protein
MHFEFNLPHIFNLSIHLLDKAEYFAAFYFILKFIQTKLISNSTKM